MDIVEKMLTFAGGNERIAGDELKRVGKNLAQLIVVLLCALALKQFYATANVNELRWILAPTTFLVEFVSGSRFQFESFAGYINSDHTFVIAASCAGVNFLLTAFLMLSLGRLWRERARGVSWAFVPLSLAIAYVTTLVANTVRIAIALRLREMPAGGWLNPDQIHRVEGIVVYFCFLILLFRLTLPPEPDRRQKSTLSWLIFPLFMYYGTALGVPLVTAAYRPGNIASDYWQHLLFVLLLPLIMLLPLVAFVLLKAGGASEPLSSVHGFRFFEPMRPGDGDVGDCVPRVVNADEQQKQRG